MPNTMSVSTNLYVSRMRQTFSGAVHEQISIQVNHQARCIEPPVRQDNSNAPRDTQMASFKVSKKKWTKGLKCGVQSMPTPSERVSHAARPSVQCHQEHKISVPPPGIPQCKKEAIEARLRQINQRFRSLSIAIFCWVIASIRGLTEIELIEVLVLKDDPTALPITDKQFLQRCSNNIKIATAGLITFETGTARFVDKDAQEYFSLTGSEYGISRADAEEFVAISCWKYLSKANIQEDMKNTSRNQNRRSIVGYKIEHFLVHCDRAQRLGKPLSGYLLHFMTSDREAFEVWKRKYLELTRTPISETELLRYFLAR